MPRFFMVAPFEHLMASTKLCQPPQSKSVFVLLVVGSKGVLVDQHQFRVIHTCTHEVGKLLSDGVDEAGLSLHALVIGHGAKRIADSKSVSV